MKSNAIDSDVRSTSDNLSSTAVFEALSHSRRQHMLQYLVQRPGAIALGDVAEYIAIEERNVTRDQYERILTGLVHTHVPHLDDAGLIRYDVGRETVSLQADVESLRPYLELTQPVLLK
jgi:hypothetical protein